MNEVIRDFINQNKANISSILKVYSCNRSVFTTSNLQILGISIHKAADRVGEVQAETDEIMSQLQEFKSCLKSLESIAVYEEPILNQCEEHKVS